MVNSYIESGNFDWFHLKHLQPIYGDAASYVNHRFLGKGGNGTTFFVSCTSGANCGMQFALKVFHKISDERRRNRFLDEVRHYRDLSHPSILRVHDEGIYYAGERAYPFAVVDFAEGNLETALGRGMPQITRIEALRYILNIASGVQYLHSREYVIVHRDIKPANILVNGKVARLGDLGLAKVLRDKNLEIRGDDEAYEAMPTFYRTPELVKIARGEKIDLTAASDIYQLGLVLYRSITGYNPQARPEDQVHDDIRLDIRRINGVGGNELHQLIISMLEDDPKRRPTASQVLSKLGPIHQMVSLADYEATGITR